MDTNRAAFCAVLGIAAVIVLVIAMNNTDGNSPPVPKNQGEKQVMGMWVDPTIPVRANATEIIDCGLHFWAPGFPDGNTGEPCRSTPHRYPAIPGGNVSNIMHKGWSAITDASPTDNLWFYNPPEVAVL